MAANFVKTGKKIIGIGRNYHAHIAEMKSATSVEPWFFLKPTTSYLQNGGTVEIPNGVDMHHEVELGVVIGRGGKNISSEMAMSHVAGYALGIDMTARNYQAQVKAKSLPWTSPKGFDTFCPISSFVPKEKIENPHDLTLWIEINGVTKQRGTTADMIFSIPRLIEHCSSIMTLEEGDLILTGTPSGVSSIVHGDKIVAGLETKAGEELARWEGDAADRQGGYSFSS
ncbi:hypothetical protein BDZ89DRAFT_1067367 [Hymenopellis radicata]|nr:hypothetical protein BDZ89DRAFT_1067367 [Hymenopellis radicata]